MICRCFDGYLLPFGGDALVFVFPLKLVVVCPFRRFFGAGSFVSSENNSWHFCVDIRYCCCCCCCRGDGVFLVGNRVDVCFVVVVLFVL